MVQFIQTTPEELASLINEGVKNRFKEFEEKFLSYNPEELLTREETCELLKIDPSTLWHWQNKGKVKPYGIGNRVYFKRSELMSSLIPLKEHGSK